MGVLAKSNLRGHTVLFVGGEWVYEDTRTATVGEDRCCAACGEGRTKEGHDGCLGTIKGAKNACCGHGDAEDAYLQYEDGSCIRGNEALALMLKIKVEVYDE